MKPENASVPCKCGCVQVAQGVLLAGLHGSEGVSVCHMYGKSAVCTSAGKCV